MTIQTGDTLPEATLTTIGADGPEEVALRDRVKGRKVVIFAVPGAFTGTCTSAHVPSFIRTKDGLEAKGVDEIICISVNDPFVMDAWAKSTGAAEAGLTFLADPASSYTTAIGMNFDAPPVGLYGRSKRYAMLLDDGVVTLLNVEAGPGECDISAGETLLAAL